MKRRTQPYQLWTIVFAGTCCTRIFSVTKFTLIPILILIIASPVFAQVWSDDFDDNTLSTFWDSHTGGSGPSVAEQNGRIEVSFPGWSTGETFSAGISTEFKLRGDFDIQVDYSLPVWPGSNGVRVGLAVCGDDMGCFGAQRSSSPFPGSSAEYYSADFGGQITIVYTDAMSGILRLVRSGDTIAGYYYEGGWIPIDAAAVGTWDAEVELNCWSHDGFFAGQNVEAEFDNFTVNSGELVDRCNDGDSTTFGYYDPIIEICFQIARPDMAGGCDPTECILGEDDPCTVDYCFNGECLHESLACCSSGLECGQSCESDVPCQAAICILTPTFDNVCNHSCVLIDYDCDLVELDYNMQLIPAIDFPVQIPIFSSAIPAPINIIGAFTFDTFVGGVQIPLALETSKSNSGVNRSQPGVDFDLATSPSYAWRITSSEGLVLPATIQFGYLEENLQPGVYESDVAVYQYRDSGWMMRACSVDSNANIVSTVVDHLGLFVLGVRGTTSSIPVPDIAQKLYDAIPNPFNPRTTISFDLPSEMAVSLRVYDVAGRLVDVLMDDEIAVQGRNEVVWRGRDMNGRVTPAGVYFYRLEAGDYVATKRMTLLK